MADTVDRAEDTVDGRKDTVDARNRLAQPAIVMDQLGTKGAGDLAQMRNLAITAADIEEAAAFELSSWRPFADFDPFGTGRPLPFLAALWCRLPPMQSSPPRCCVGGPHGN